eukprot:TRINITY_DN8479_c0_g1_i2.p1 TRINITY_DN8479_c0_g1~~TRINITY_DN8479_c0_g1_i2.p1  ORF type:complete len:503 (+),score=110.58 TRINITY_DN8479_c0_g1_i2:112-1620(+)
MLTKRSAGASSIPSGVETRSHKRIRTGDNNNDNSNDDVCDGGENAFVHNAEDAEEDVDIDEEQEEGEDEEGEENKMDVDGEQQVQQTSNSNGFDNDNRVGSLFPSASHFPTYLESPPDFNRWGHQRRNFVVPQLKARSVTCLTKLRQADEFVDFQLKLPEGTVFCHKIIIAAASNYFVKILKAQRTANSVSLDFGQGFFNAVSDVVDFMYSGKCELNLNNVFKITVVAQKFEIVTLAKLCDNYLTSTINEKNFMHFFEFSNTLPDEFVVKKSVWRFILLNLQKVPNEVLLAFEMDLIQRILSEDNTGLADEGDLLDLLIRWLEHNEWRSQHAYDLLSLIRFPFVCRSSWQRFLDHPFCCPDVKLLMVKQMAREIHPRKDILTNEPFEFFAVDIPESGSVDSEPFHRYGWNLKLRIIISDEGVDDDDAWTSRHNNSKNFKLAVVKVSRSPGSNALHRGSGKFKIHHPTNDSKSKCLNIASKSFLPTIPHSQPFIRFVSFKRRQ